METIKNLWAYAKEHPFVTARAIGGVAGTVGLAFFAVDAFSPLTRSEIINRMPEGSRTERTWTPKGIEKILRNDPCGYSAAMADPNIRRIDRAYELINKGIKRRIGTVTEAQVKAIDARLCRALWRGRTLRALENLGSLDNYLLNHGQEETLKIFTDSLRTFWEHGGDTVDLAMDAKHLKKIKGAIDYATIIKGTCASYQDCSAADVRKAMDIILEKQSYLNDTLYQRLLQNIVYRFNDVLICVQDNADHNSRSQNCKQLARDMNYFMKTVTAERKKNGLWVKDIKLPGCRTYARDYFLGGYRNGRPEKRRIERKNCVWH